MSGPVVNRTDASGLDRQQWCFWYDERHHALVLDRWARLSRPTVRHKFREAENPYERLRHRRGDQLFGVPAIPADVAVEAKEQFANALRVGTEGEFRR